MLGDLHCSIDRRRFGRTALMGAASAFLAVDSLAALEAGAREIVDARKLGAAGDGKTDDTLRCSAQLIRPGRKLAR
jgi:hypothetical protein